MRYLPDTGAPIDKTYSVPAGQRLTVNIEGEDAALANAAVATQVTSTVPIIVERAQYWPDPAPNWYEAHNSFGVTSTATRWGLAEGRVGLDPAYQTYILLANPNTNAVDVTITFLREDGTTLIKNFHGAALEPLQRGGGRRRRAGAHQRALQRRDHRVASDRGGAGDVFGSGGRDVAGGHQRHRHASSVVTLRTLTLPSPLRARDAPTPSPRLREGWVRGSSASSPASSVCPRLTLPSIVLTRLDWIESCSGCAEFSFSR